MLTNDVARRLISTLALGVLCLAAACASSGPRPSARSDRVAQVTLPASLEKQRSAYERDIASALTQAAGCFESWGVARPDQPFIARVQLFESSAEARAHLAKTFGVSPDDIPASFAGTVDGTTLYLVGRDAYRTIWKQTYPDQPWSEKEYRRLVVHEAAHRVHEAIAIRDFGSSDAMGPGWFFEGLAVTCAGQFDTGGPLLDRAGILALTSAEPPKASYPVYGRLVRSLAALHPMHQVIAAAARPDFPRNLAPIRD